MRPEQRSDGRAPAARDGERLHPGASAKDMRIRGDTFTRTNIAPSVVNAAQPVLLRATTLHHDDHTRRPQGNGMTYRPDVVRVASDDAAVSERVRAVSVPSKVEAILAMPEGERLAWKARNEGWFRQIEARRDGLSRTLRRRLNCAGASFWTELWPLNPRLFLCRFA